MSDKSLKTAGNVFYVKLRVKSSKLVSDDSDVTRRQAVPDS